MKNPSKRLTSCCRTNALNPHGVPIALLLYLWERDQAKCDYESTFDNWLPTRYPTRTRCQELHTFWSGCDTQSISRHWIWKMGTMQIPIAKTSRECTAFTEPESGLYHCKVMPFDLHSAHATFYQSLERCQLHSCAYLDDIILIGATLEEHVKHLREVLQRLREANLRFNSKKCSSFKRSLLYLGHVCEEGIPKEPSAVRILSPPATC